MSTASPFRVVLLTGCEPQEQARLVSLIHQEVPDAKVCGILYEYPVPKTFRQRVRAFMRKLRRWAFIRYAAQKVLRSLLHGLAGLGSRGLRFLHAHVGRPQRSAGFGLEELAAFCQAQGCALHATRDIHAPESLEFVRELRPDLGLVHGTRVLKAKLFEIPRLGSINIHKRKVPDYRGGGPVGLWELLDGQAEIGVTVHRVEAKLDAGAVVNSATIPIEPFDTLTSLALKANVIANDLLVSAVADFARNTVQDKVQEGPSRMFRSPPPEELARHEKELASRRAGFRPAHRWPTWKLLLKSFLLGPWILVRNWVQRFRGSFPIIVLFHHLVTDRPHRMGISTDWFLRHVQYLQKHYQVVGLDEAVAMLKSGVVKAPTVVLTFDDGYRDNFLNLRAVADATGVPVTLFICTGNVTTQQEFEHDVKRGLRGFLPMTWEQVVALDRCRGVRIGSHTRFHFDCGSTDRDGLQSEICGAKADLEERLGHEIDFFSFPFGIAPNISPEAVELAKATYPYVCFAHGGGNYPGQGNPSWYILRIPHPSSFWELELALQSILEFTRQPEIRPLPSRNAMSNQTAQA